MSTVSSVSASTVNLDSLTLKDFIENVHSIARFCEEEKPNKDFFKNVLPVISRIVYSYLSAKPIANANFAQFLIQKIEKDQNYGLFKINDGNVNSSKRVLSYLENAPQAPITEYFKEVLAFKNAKKNQEIEEKKGCSLKEEEHSSPHSYEFSQLTRQDFLDVDTAHEDLAKLNYKSDCNGRILTVKPNNLPDQNLRNKKIMLFPLEILNKEEISVLKMKNLGICFLPSEIRKLKNLTSLRLIGSQLASLPPKIQHLNNLEELDLSNNQLTSLPPEIEHLNLKELNLSNNQLTSLPLRIYFKNLGYLNLSGNQFTSLPSEIQHLKNLRVLNLSNNQLTSLPPGIHFNNLGDLNLSGNQFTSLPSGIQHLKRLKILDLSNNPLSSLPDGIGDLTNLKKLQLSRGDENLLSEELRKKLLSNNVKIIFQEEKKS